MNTELAAERGGGRPGAHIQNLLAAPAVRPVHVHGAVEAARPQQRLVQHLRRPHRPAGLSTLLTFLVSWWLLSAGRARSHEGRPPAAAGIPSASTAQARTLRAQQSRRCSEAAARPRPRAHCSAALLHAMHRGHPRLAALDTAGPRARMPGLAKGKLCARQWWRRRRRARPGHGRGHAPGAVQRASRAHGGGQWRRRRRWVHPGHGRAHAPEAIARAMQGPRRARRGGWWRQCR